MPGALYERIAAGPEPTQVVAQYVWGDRTGNRDELVFRDRDADGNGTLDERLYCLMDYFNPVAVVDAAGDVKERYTWSSFGVRKVMAPDWSEREDSLFVWDFGFHGQFLDTESGCYDYGYRYYSPEIGRWLSRDPIGERGGMNVYGYVAIRAPNFHDRYGTNPGAVCTAGAGTLLTEVVIAAAFGLSVSACAEHPTCADLLTLAQPGSTELWIAASLNFVICRCKTLVREEVISHRCTIIPGKRLKSRSACIACIAARTAANSSPRQYHTVIPKTAQTTLRIRLTMETDLILCKRNSYDHHVLTVNIDVCTLFPE